MVVYQLHIGTYAPSAPGARFHLPRCSGEAGVSGGAGRQRRRSRCPCYEMEDSPSQGYPGLGYQGANLYSPEFDYTVYERDRSPKHSLATDQPAAGRQAYLRAHDAGRHYARSCADEGEWLSRRTSTASPSASTWCTTTRVDGRRLTLSPSRLRRAACCTATTRASTSGAPAPCPPTRAATGTTTKASTSPTRALSAGSPSRCGTRTCADFCATMRWAICVELHADGFRYDEISMLLAMNTGERLEQLERPDRGGARP